MAGVPVYCERCNSLFESPTVIIGAGASVSFANSGTTCLRCGNMARILDGTYTSVGDALKLVRGSAFTRQQVTLLQELRASLAVQRHADNETIPKEVIDAVSEIQPELGAALKLLKKDKAGWAVLMLFLFIVLRQCSSEGTSINIDISSHVTVVAPRIEQTALYYPHQAKQQDRGNDAKAAPDSAQGKKD